MTPKTMPAPRRRPPRPPRRPRVAAQYVRMSTDRQEHSIQNQSECIANYAREHGIVVTATYADEACSGLTLEGRPALRRLIADVSSRAIDVSDILVFDVSRWGRFQDADEGAYYEFICRSAGVRIHYCAEEFENDGGISSTLMKAIKRVMASEYSRELSQKVWAGHCRLARLGYRQGGPCTLGHQRVLVGARGTQKVALEPGDRKVLQSERVVLRLGTAKDQDLVRQIFRMFVSENATETQIVSYLNARGVKNNSGRPWNRNAVHCLLTNRLYAGELVYNQTSQKLGGSRVQNPESLWVRSPGAVPAIIDQGVFALAQARIAGHPRPYEDEELVACMRRLLAEHGRLSTKILDGDPNSPNSTTFARRFGDLPSAYRLAGFQAAATQA